MTVNERGVSCSSFAYHLPSREGPACPTCKLSLLNNSYLIFLPELPWGLHEMRYAKVLCKISNIKQCYSRCDSRDSMQWCFYIHYDLKKETILRDHRMPWICTYTEFLHIQSVSPLLVPLIMSEWKPLYITPLCSTSGVRDNCGYVARSRIGFSFTILRNSTFWICIWMGARLIAARCGCHPLWHLVFETVKRRNKVLSELLFLC